MTNLISFDWAMKRVLRDKANHAVLEGLMTSLLNEKFTIVRFLESESNQEDENDKFNRVDILAESEKGELTIFEIQNNRELAYFHRILYGVSKAITDYINLGEDYEKVRKVYSHQHRVFHPWSSERLCVSWQDRVPRFARPSRHPETLQPTERGVLRRHLREG